MALYLNQSLLQVAGKLNKILLHQIERAAGKPFTHQYHDIPCAEAVLMQSKNFPQDALDIISGAGLSYRFFSYDDGKPGAVKLVRFYQNP